MRIFSKLLILLLPGCTYEPTESIGTSAPNAFEGEELTGPKFRPEIQLELLVEVHQNSGTPLILGTTNLPPGTRLSVSVSSPETGWRDYFAQDDSLVQPNGSFEAGPFSDKGSPLQGDLVAEVSLVKPEFQSVDIQSVIGGEGELLKGPLVTQDSTGITVGVVRSFTLDSVGDSGEKSEDLAKHIGECRRLYSEVRNMGRELEKASKKEFTNEDWGVFIRDFNQRLDDLREKIRRTEESNARHYLGFAAGDLVPDAITVSRVIFHGQPKVYEPKQFQEDLRRAGIEIDKLETAKSGLNEFRTWATADGQFSVEARFVSFTVGVVEIEKKNGVRVKVPLEKLGEEDHKFIDSKR